MKAIPTTAAHWFLRGGLAGILLCAAANALSYFARSDGWGNLAGLAPSCREALGFPVAMWEAGNAYGGFYADYPALGLNVLFAFVVAALCGAVTVTQRALLTRMVRDFEARGQPVERRNAQFSLRGLLAVSTVCAVLAALARWAARPEFLLATFAFGPWLLVGIAMLPHRIPWQQRVWILAICAVALIGGTVAVGAALETPVPFDRVLFGIFVCWTPPSALVAVGLTITLVWNYRRGSLRELM